MEWDEAHRQARDDMVPPMKKPGVSILVAFSPPRMMLVLGLALPTVQFPEVSVNMAQRYIANNIPLQKLGTPPRELLPYTLQLVLRYTPPRESYAERHLGGLFSGYTGLAYLFLQLSSLYPNLQVSGHDLLYWAKQYLKGDRGSLIIEKGNCGLACERLSFQAVLACVTKDKDHVINFLSDIPKLLGPYPSPQDDPFPSEIPYGRAGALYLLRMVKHWVPEYEALYESPIYRLTDKILNTDSDGRGNWEWHGKRYFGAAHGDIGIITQLVLSDPSLAPCVSTRLRKLIELQTPYGNWPSSERALKEGRGHTLVQWCHGAPGFLYSLMSLRPYFPELHEEIDVAVKRGQLLVWREGLLIKEPSLCHGIFGNALVQPRGSFREHFLALATADAVDKVRRHDSRLFTPAAYGNKSSVLMNYLPSAAWTWAVCEQETPPLIMFNDL